MLARVMPRVELEVNRRPMPWDAIAWEPRIHLALFVHRVDGLEPGLYVLVRDPAKLDKLKRAMRSGTPTGPSLPGARRTFPFAGWKAAMRGSLRRK